jgi:hypothetical protein
MEWENRDGSSQLRRCVPFTLSLSLADTVNRMSRINLHFVSMLQVNVRPFHLYHDLSSRPLSLRSSQPISRLTSTFSPPQLSSH